MPSCAKVQAYFPFAPGVHMLGNASVSVDEFSTESQSSEETILIQPLPLHQTPVPTLHSAFYSVCQALESALSDDIELLEHAKNIQGWHDNGNVVIAWQHAVRLLEKALGAKMG